MKTETQIFFLEVNIGLTVIKGNQRLYMVTKFKMNFLSSAEENYHMWLSQILPNPRV